ncbi:MAG TPA: ferritin-like domain-containing protein [Stellaceae bacterium]|nr:ferritin-like domain-containing protein [Stellaceae bacterium]
MTQIEAQEQAALPKNYDRIAIGSQRHKELFCAVLLDTFDPYRPAVIDWPDLAPEVRGRLAGLPFWDVALETEENAGTRMQALADATADPLIRQALALNAFEERRHKEVLGRMMRFYGIPVGGDVRARLLRDAQWAFLRTGYGECFDSFFAFGLFEMARRTGFFPSALIGVFEPVIQEEARHNLFFVNWVAYAKAAQGWPRRWGFAARCLAALAVQIARRLSIAQSVDGDNFTRKGGAALGIDLDARRFLALCLAENDRRLAPYDPRLLRPRIMPAVARLAMALLPRAGAPR